MKPAFYGGIKPRHFWPENKLISNFDFLAKIEPSVVYIPLNMHIGAPALPIVRTGDKVVKGQPVAMPAPDALSVGVHASISGTVQEIKSMLQIDGGYADCVVIRNDGRRAELELGPARNLVDLSALEIAEICRAAGVAGLGGAGFPTYAKLLPGESEIDFLIINAAECEPVLKADYAVMLHYGDLIVQGILAALKACGASRAVIAIESDKLKAIVVMQKLCSAFPQIDVAVVPHIYPQGGESQLIQTLTGLEVPEGKQPDSLGILMLNVATVTAVARAVFYHMPLTNRVCTVAGDVVHPRNVLFPVGCLAEDLLDYCGGFNGVPSKILAGGPMMGRTLPHLMIPLTHGSNGLLVVNENHDADHVEKPCIRCDRCVEACPVRLAPYRLDDYLRRKKFKQCFKWHAQSCINCGCCTYVCPARRRLAHSVTLAKKYLDRQGR